VTEIIEDLAFPSRRCIR